MAQTLHNRRFIIGIYIDDNLEPVYNNDSYHDSDLDHYLLAPDGEYLEDISELELSDSDNALEHDLDPEPSPGPVDPGYDWVLTMDHAPA